MKKKELQELRNKSAEEIKKTLADLRKKKLEVEAALMSGKESNVKALSKIRRDIAQTLTIQGIIERSAKKEN